jgi:hypothetical protein
VTADVEKFVDQMLRSTREEITRADTKASLLLAAFGVVTGALLAGLLAQRWSPFMLANRVEWLWWAGIAAAVVALILLGAAVFPRTVRKHEKPNVLAYFADVDAYAAESDEELKKALVRSAEASGMALMDQLRSTSRIAALKYRCVRRALWFSAGAAIACALAVVINGTSWA